MRRVWFLPAETRGQSGSMGSSGVSRGSGLDTQLQQHCSEDRGEIGQWKTVRIDFSISVYVISTQTTNDFHTDY